MPLTAETTLHVKSMTRALYVVVNEEDRFILQFRDEVKKYEETTYVFNVAVGLQPIVKYIDDWTSKKHEANTQAQGINEALIHIYKDQSKNSASIYIITDPERWFKDDQVVRRVLNILHQGRNNLATTKVLVFVGHRRVIPEKLQRYIEVVDETEISPDEITSAVENMATSLNVAVPDNAVQTFNGFTSYEIDSAMTQAVVQTKLKKTERKVDPAYIAQYKRSQIKKTDLVQLVDTKGVTFDSVGGAGRFKTWAKKQKATWSEEGRAFGLEPPRGVLLVGVYGCGKSLSAKALANEWGLPLVQFEMGKIRSSAVGESEANLYRALRIVDSVSPCVTGDTEVTLADGTTKPIQLLWEEWSSGSDELRVQCWNEKNFRVQQTQVKAITCRKASAYQIEAANGFFLNTSAEHKNYVMRGGLPEWVETKDLLPGDMMAASTFVSPGEVDCVKFHPVGMREYNGQLRRGGGGFRDAVVPQLPVKWTTDLGWVLGIIEGDGFIGVNDTIALVNTSEKLLSSFEGRIARLFGLEPKRVDNTRPASLPGVTENSVFQPCWTSSITNQLASEFLRSARQHILSAPPQVRAAFFAGWVDADGCVGPDKISLTVKHPKMWSQRTQLARQLVQSLGVVPSKFEMPNLEITGSRAMKLASKLGDFLVEKGGKAACLVTSDIGFDRGMGFACGQLLHDARKESGCKFSDLGVSSGTTWTYESGLVPVSERHMVNYINSLGEYAADLQTLLSADCRWVKVKNVSDLGENTVYDLVCEGDDTHSFIANGLITHNCVMWIDEAEKTLAGAASSSYSDAGTTARLLGILSTWTQESKIPVSLVMTANSLKTLPPEMVNRLPERFFFDLPSEEDRIDILKIHGSKLKQDMSRFSLVELAEKAKNLVGREIEQAIKAAMVESFHQKKPSLDQGILAQELERKPRIITTMTDEINEILSWVGYDESVDDGVRAHMASEKRSEQFLTISNK